MFECLLLAGSYMTDLCGHFGTDMTTNMSAEYDHEQASIISSDMSSIVPEAASTCRVSRWAITPESYDQSLDGHAEVLVCRHLFSFASSFLSLPHWFHAVIIKAVWGQKWYKWSRVQDFNLENFVYLIVTFSAIVLLINLKIKFYSV